MIESCSTAFKERNDEHNLMLCRNFSVELGGRAGNGFGQIEKVGVFRLAEIETVVQFLQYHKFSTLLGSLGNMLSDFLLVGFDIGRASQLDESNFHERGGGFRG